MNRPQSRAGLVIACLLAFMLLQREGVVFVQQGNPMVLQYGTYFGGSAIDKAVDLALGPDGAVYLTGWTTSSNFPVRAAHQQRYAGDWDGFVAKLDCAASAVEFSTYLGGSRRDNRFAKGVSVGAGGGIAVDRFGHAFVTGRTTSDDFPTASAVQTRRAGGADAFVAQFDETGHLVYSTYFGGSGEDEAWGIAVDARSHAFIIGKTTSDDLPILEPLSPTRYGRTDAFIAEFDQDGALVFASYLGGSGDELGSALSGAAVAVDRDGFVYFAGDTDSANFPVTNDAYQKHFQGVSDLFAVKFDPVRHQILYSTYVGGAGTDNTRGAAVDPNGNLYITGHTSGLFPVTAGAFQVQHHGQNDALLVKLSENGARLLFATYVGGSAADVGMDVSVDAAGVPTVVGFTDSRDFPLVDPLPMRFAGPRDGFVARFSPDGSQLTFGSYFGGNDNDVGYAVASAPGGVLYVTARTSSTDWPVPGGFQPFPGGGQDAYLARLSPASTSAAGCRPDSGIVSETTRQIPGNLRTSTRAVSLGSSPVQRLKVMDVVSGDVRISVSWNTNADLDLHVVDPSGEETYYDNARSTSGGELDIDSNAACDPTKDNRSEQIRWPTNRAPAGNYVVRLDYWQSCGNSSTSYTLIVIDGSSSQSFTGIFTGVGDVGGVGSGSVVTTITR